MRRVVVFILFVSASICQAAITDPKTFFGHDICEDYWLADYTQFSAYWNQLAKESNRIHIISIGKTEEGRDQLMAIITDPSNYRRLELIRKQNAQFALAKDFDDAQAKKLAKNSKAVVWIDGGLHATEVLVAQQLLQTAYDLVSRNDEENKRILRDCVILLGHANPDGMDLVCNWYMRRPVPATRSLEGVPVLYQKYAGHDNNRDFYMSNLKETQNINRIFFEEWFPQIVYNHHQSAPSGTIMYIPPFRNPFNFHIDPIAQIGIDAVGLQMHQRLIAEGLGGTVMRSSAPYSGWWNGGLRTITYFHNMIGILTETWGSPNPTSTPFVKEKQIPNSDWPMPVDVRLWHLRDSLHYEVSANYAILDYASRYRETLVYNQYRMGRNSIERGSRDHWTRYPSRINSLGLDSLTKPEYRDARAYVIPNKQWNPAGRDKFLDMMIRCGVRVQRLKENRRNWATGDYVITCDQAFRPHILDMFEKQDHPDDFQYPGGPPIAPYDNAGYTPAMTMGLEFERIIEGDIVGELKSVLEDVTLGEVDKKPAFPSLASKPRVALWDRYGGSMPSGWTRFVFDRFGIDHKVLFASDINAGELDSSFAAIVFVSGAIPARDPEQSRENRLLTDTTIPFHYRLRMEPLSHARTLPKVREFAEGGGTVFAIGSSASNLARAWNLPVRNALVEKDANGEERNLPSTKFYIPGSVLQVKLNQHRLTRGMPVAIGVMFDESPAFRVEDPSKAQVVAYFDSDNPLRSGWAWGQQYLKDAAAIVEVELGKGRVILCGPEVTFRGQTYASFPILFNSILRRSDQ